MSEARLVGDIGGTHVRLALARNGQVGAAWVAECSGFTGPREAIAAFLDAAGETPVGGVLAIAGPARSRGVVQGTNGWLFEASALEPMLGQVRLINDFAALALAAPHLPEESLRPLGAAPAGHPGEPIVVLGPGTGLGVAALLYGDDENYPVAGEGGHIGFAPRDAFEKAVADLLAARVERVTLETILCGAGLARLHDAIAEVEGRPAPGLHQTEIVEAALALDDVCRATVDRFWDILASAAGDTVLMFGARGGAYIGGGVALRTASLVDGERFRESFIAKAPRRAFVEQTPAFLITDPMAALLGAAQMALRL